MKKNILLALLLLSCHLNFYGQVHTQCKPDSFVVIGEGLNGFSAGLQGGDRFSRDHDQAGDIDGDGVIDLVVGARSDDDGATDAGAVYILFMNNDGTVKSNQKISMTAGGFNETLNAGNFFGYGVAGIGDYNGDNIPDIAVAASAPPNNALYIIHLDTNGTVKSYVKNSNVVANGLTAVGDLNNDGRIDLVAGNPGSDAGGTNRGGIAIMFLNASSQINSTVTINSNLGGFGAGLSNEDAFGGREVAMLGDIDGDGNKELAVGAFRSNNGEGAIWILSLDSVTFNVVSKIQIAEGINGFTDTLTQGSNPNGSTGANFGHAMTAPGDLNGDGVPDLITGANQQSEGWVYILYLNPDKTVKTYTKINNTDGGFDLTLAPEERFSRSISYIGDLRGDGSKAVNIGGGAGGTGTLYILFFEACDFTPAVGSNFYQGGNVLFTNWNHAAQTVSDSLTLEQCVNKAFETEAPYMTYNYNDGRCVCKDSTATFAVSNENSTAFTNNCFENFVIPLPLNLEDFNVSINNCSEASILLTAYFENPRSYLNIQRATDRSNSNWLNVGEIHPRSFNQYEQYVFQDNINNIKENKIYYRVEQVDPNNQTSYSITRSIEKNCESTLFEIYPNPTNSKIFINGIDEIESIGLYTITGTKVDLNFNRSNFEVDMSELSNGIYLLSIENSEGLIINTKVHKN